MSEQIIPDTVQGPYVDYCGEISVLDPEAQFLVGREGDLEIDDNKFLHRRFLAIEQRGGVWWIVNVGSRLSATIADADGFMQAWLAPQGEMPIIFSRTIVRFTAGRTAYEFDIHLPEALYLGTQREIVSVGTTTVGALVMTQSQRQLILALAEPILTSGRTVSSLPTSAQAAARLGWSLTKFNRKLDNVCERLEATGVRGLHGTPGSLATSRRARLVEYALATRLVTVEDLPLLDRPSVTSAADHQERSA